MCKEKNKRKQCGGGEAKQNQSGHRKNDLPLGPLRWVVWLLNKKHILQWENNPVLAYHLTIEGERDANGSRPRGGTSKANLLEWQPHFSAQVLKKCEEGQSQDSEHLDARGSSTLAAFLALIPWKGSQFVSLATLATLLKNCHFKAREEPSGKAYLLLGLR